MIRPATLGDVPALVALENACFDHDIISAASFRRAIGNPETALVLVDECDGVITGYVMGFLRKDHTRGRVYSLAVGAQHRGKGLGGCLMLAMCARFAARGKTKARLEVRQDQPANVALYERCGFVIVGAKKSYYEDGADAFIMDKDLH